MFVQSRRMLRGSVPMCFSPAGSTLSATSTCCWVIVMKDYPFYMDTQVPGLPAG